MNRNQYDCVQAQDRPHPVGQQLAGLQSSCRTDRECRVAHGEVCGTWE